MTAALLHLRETLVYLSGWPLALSANTISGIALLYAWRTRHRVDALIKKLTPAGGK